MSQGKSAEKVVQEIRRKTRRQFSAEEKIRIVLEGLRGEESIAALCRREGWNRSQIPLVCELLTFVFVWSMSLTARKSS